MVLKLLKKSVEKQKKQEMKRRRKAIKELVKLINR